MRILIFNELYHPNKIGGAEISTQLLAEKLVELGNEVHVCTSSDYNKTEIFNGVCIHYIRQYNLYWSFTHYTIPKYKKIIWHLLDSYNILFKRRANLLIKKINPDIIHTNVIAGFSSVIWKCAKENNIPVIHTLRDYYLMCVRSTLYNKKNCTTPCVLCQTTSIPKKKLTKHVDAIIGISEFILNKHLVNGYFKNASINKVIPNAVSSTIDSSYLPERKKHIGYLGRINPSKGIEYLIENFNLIDNKDYILTIAGNGDSNYCKYLKEKYESSKVKFIGRVDSNHFLREISLLVVPSIWHEPFGRVIIEAIENKCPVFASNKGGMPELINKNIGRIFDIDKKDSLSFLLQDFIDNKMYFNFSANNNNSYSAINIATEYEKIYKDIISLKRKK